MGSPPMMLSLPNFTICYTSGNMEAYRKNNKHKRKGNRNKKKEKKRKKSKKREDDPSIQLVLSLHGPRVWSKEDKKDLFFAFTWGLFSIFPRID
jgi:hypothetical protein